jgi:tetratricopeptide (TPR) repeat protein
VTRSPILAALAASLLVGIMAGCAQLEELTRKSPDATPKPAAPQITEAMLRERAREQLAAGVKQYESGEYDAALKSLQGALDHGLLSKQEQSIARKNLAFVHCVSNREAACRDEFRKAFEIYPDFALSAAEDGHPIWGPVYRNVRTQLITEREAAQARSRPIIPLGKAEQMLADGMVKYGAGDYDAALRLLEGALKEGLPDKGDRIRAQKQVAFSQCLKERFRECKAAFLKIFDIEPAFDLAPAEAGHPSWTRTFASAKAQAKKAMAERAAKEAKEKSAREKAAKPAAVPKKN